MSKDSSEPEQKSSGYPPRGPNVPWGPLSAVIVTVVAFIGAQILSLYVLGFISSLLGLYRGDRNTLYDSIAGQFYFVLVSDALILLILWLFLRRRKATLGQLGFGRNPALKDLAYTAVGYAVYFAFLIVGFSLAQAFVPIDMNQKQDLGFDTLFTSGERLMALVSLVILPPIVEETVFRGFLFSGLRKKMKFLWATIITSLLFATPHLFGSAHGLLWVAGLDTLIMSFVLCYLREKTGSLWASIGVHAVKNLIAYYLLLSSVALR